MIKTLARVLACSNPNPFHPSIQRLKFSLSLSFLSLESFMGTKSPVMMSEMGVGGFNGDDLGKDLGFLLDRERELNIYRSGSAPPTVEGSLNAIGGLEEEMRADPAYLSYYYSNVNMNPRLPPPVLSKEDWRSTKRLGGIGDRRKSSEIGKEEEENGGGVNGGGEWVSGGGDGLIGLSLGRQKSFAEIFQDDMSQTNSVPGYSSRPASGLRSDRNVQNVSGLQNNRPATFASVLASSLSRNNTPDSHHVPNVGVRAEATTNNNISNGAHSFNHASSDAVETEDLLAALSGMRLSSTSALDANNNTSMLKRQQESDAHQKFLLDLRSAQNSIKQSAFSNSLESANSLYLDLSKGNIGLGDFSNSTFGSDMPASSNSYMKAHGPGSSAPCHRKADNPNATVSNYGLSGYSINPTIPSTSANQISPVNLPPLYENAATASAVAALGMDSRALGGGFSSVDPLYLQYLKTAEYAAQAAANLSDPYLDLLGMQDAYLGGLVQQKPYNAPFLGKSGLSSPGYYGNHSIGLNMSYPSSPLASSIPTSPMGPISPLRHNERNLRFHTSLSNFAGGVTGSWNPSLNGNLEESFPSTLLEEFKSNKTTCFELSDIAGHVVEFSADQFGSRFIQQKLETAITEEKNMVYEEIMPQALSLMTDVFGNYVIQKFFEHGSAAQIRELANELNGHVLALSLQMYGCRVIQKAIEVVSLDQQIKMVSELDGHIVRCVRDQNGNHVIQKCIECIPQDAIHFIISSFYDHVVMLSTHPYGCRVIQRVLEHCDDPKTQQIVMDEIMQCVCMLAQDQYGNYVVQHVLEHGKPHERSAIIKKLAGQIVHMSQQKFASNVVEKCLTFGGHIERQILVNEMLGSTDENEPLQAMMKDQFANYVVQKVLETCDDHQRELILSRIKVHLNALKKYTYGKHIVARVEKLVAAGERRIGLQSSYHP